jgi:predicted hydrocarbon binding protein
MGNVSLTSVGCRAFACVGLGNIEEESKKLGVDMPVAVYRLLQFAMRDVITRAHGKEAANELFREAGKLAGMEFAKNVLDTELDFEAFVKATSKILLDMRIGVLSVENVSKDADEIILTVGEDLDCSGLPKTGEIACHYDEGFLAGILEVYTGKIYEVREVDCWATGDKTCRFCCRIQL